MAVLPVVFGRWSFEFEERVIPVHQPTLPPAPVAPPVPAVPTGSTAASSPPPLFREGHEEDDHPEVPPAIVAECRSPDEHTLVVRLTGEVDHFSAAPLRVLLVAAAVYGYRHLELDCAEVSFCDSGLLSALGPWQRDGRTLRVAAASDRVAAFLGTAAGLVPPATAPAG
ncbi:STAS domain-containing protein (plasmid) [Streptomyces sp. BI20]|uniref:STAS domain-containing protein n=1 Tax=Streptomyces sp. BI20 TaxID=3403460 RepID=UPI003C7571A6